WGHDEPTMVDSTAGAYHIVAGVGDQYVESVTAFPGHGWTHLAVAFSQGHAVRLSRNAYLDAGTKDALALTGDLTCEVAVQLDDLAAPHGLLTRGRRTDTAANRVPYALTVETDGSLTFAFVDADGAAQALRSNAG